MTTPVKRKLATQQASKGARQRAVTSSRLHRLVNQQEALDTAARLACQLLKGDIAGISLADEQGHLAVRSHFGLPEKCAARLRANARYGPFGFIAGKKRRPHIVTGQELEDLTPGLGLCTMVVMPLKTGKTLKGYLGVGYRRKRKFTSHELQLARLFADYATIAIETASLYQEERYQRHRSGALLSAVAASSPKLSLEAVLTKICRSILKLSVAERCGVYLLGEDRTKFEAGLTLGDVAVDWMPQVDVEVNDYVTPKAIKMFGESRKPIIVEHLPGSGVMTEGQVQHFGVKSVAAYPLIFRRPIGLLVTSTYRDFVSFPQEEVDTLSAIARQAAVIIESARLYERERRQRQRSEMLTKVLAAAAATLDLREVLKKVCQATLELTVGNDVSIFLLDNESGVLVPTMSVAREDSGVLDKFLKTPAGFTRAPKTLRVNRHIFARKRPLIIEDTANSPSISPWWAKTADVRSLVHYPLRVQNKIIGTMAVASRHSQGPFPKGGDRDACRGSKSGGGDY